MEEDKRNDKDIDGSGDKPEGHHGGAGWDRRRFLGAAAGAGAAGALAVGALASPAGAAPRSLGLGGGGYWAPGGHNYSSPGKFGRIFPDLPPFATPSDELTAALIELGRPGGLLDANDPLEVGPVRLITEPALSPHNLDNPAHTAGTTFFGQFIDHDLTRDGGSPLGQPLDLRRSTNLRTPRFDLDSVYGDGPTGSPQLYTRGTVRLRVESGGQFEDLPRDARGNAILGDPRNDENLIISGLHAAMLKFHNAVADRVEASRSRRFWGWSSFAEAQRLVRWHYQWLVLHEYLPQIIRRQTMDDITTHGPRWFNPFRPSLPVEFQGAAYRFGHSMVRPSYRANLAGDQGKPFFGLIFDPANPDNSSPDPDNLMGGKRAPRRFVGWQTFFDFGDGQVKHNKRIDTKISTPLFHIPMGIIDRPPGTPAGPTTLPGRNLMRQVTWALPSGQAVAKAMGVPALARADLADLEPFGANLASSTPLWFYVLREADVMEDGRTLGPVGGRIVAEVFWTLLKRDPTSYLWAQPGWRPTLPSKAGKGEFRMTDLLTVAGVDPGSRGQ